MGFCGKILWSLPAATTLPEKVRPPTMMARPAVIMENASGCEPVVMVRIPAIIEARPPNPFSRPTSWGICIILTLTAIIAPIAVPTSMAIHSSSNVKSSKYHMVRTIARSIDTEPIRLPATAFLTLLSMEMPNKTTRVRTAAMM